MNEQELVGALREHWVDVMQRIGRVARQRFGWCMDGDALEELIQEAHCLAWEWGLSAARKGKAPWETPWAFARLAVKAAAWGARFGSGRSSGDILTAAKEERISEPDQGCWWLASLAYAEGPDPWELAAARIDFPRWLRQLPRRMRRVARDLGKGRGTYALAKLMGVTPGRVSQFRRKLFENWQRFQGPEVFPQVGAK